MRREFLATNFAFTSTSATEIYVLYDFLHDSKWNDEILRDTSFRLAGAGTPFNSYGSKWILGINFNDYGYSFRMEECDAARELDFLQNHNPLEMIVKAKFPNVSIAKTTYVACQKIA